MQTIVAQDDIRQQFIAMHCGLINSTKRYGADAYDENGIEFEIKSGTTQTHISTARDFGFNILREYKRKYWIIASGLLASNKEYVMNELYIAHPDNLSFFFNKVESMLEANQRVVNIIKEASIPLTVQDKEIMHKILNRGITMNDPRISMKDVRIHCIKIDHINPETARVQVKKFVAENPITIVNSANINRFVHNFW